MPNGGAKLLGHPIHQMLIVFPLGLFPTAVFFDVLYLITGSMQWTHIAYWLIPIGLVSALVAAGFGLIDWLAIPQGTRARRVGALHGIGNVIVVALFGVSWYLRVANTGFPPPSVAIVLGAAAVVLALVTGWLGGELVDQLGVGVAPGANVNAPSSLRGEHKEAHARPM